MTQSFVNPYMFKVSFWVCLFVGCIHIIAAAQSKEADSLIRLLHKKADDTAKVTLYENLALTLRFTDPAEAILYGRKGIELAKRLDFDKGAAGCYLRVSSAYIYADKKDTALIYLDTALLYAHKVNDINRLGLAYLNRADIYRQMQNFSQSLRDCETALQYADQANNDDVRARINQTIGAVYHHQQIYPQSIVYFNKALLLYRRIGNLRMSANVLNNMGLTYKATGDLGKAAEVTRAAIQILDSLKDITNLSIFNGNLCDVYNQMGNYEAALKYADKAMGYAMAQENEKQVAIVWSLMGHVYIKQKRFADVIEVGDKALSVFKKTDDTDLINTTADLLAEAYAQTGNYTKAYSCLKESAIARDSLTKWKYDDEIAAMQAKFSVKEKDKEIVLLAKDKELQQQKLQRQRLLMLGAAAMLIFAFFGIWLFSNRNKLKQRMKELELRNQIAADLHDEVGSSLSSIHMLSQMATKGTEGSNREILARMSSNAKETMERMGDIVWMIKPGETEAGSLRQRMERFAYEIGSSKNIALLMDLDDLEKVKFTMEQRKNIYLIFKEAINNAVKYADTEKITVKAILQQKELIVRVQDFGKGFDSQLIKKGNGLDNMQHRARELQGTIQIKPETGLGTVIELTIPVVAPHK
jgi:two-component system, NarL family, sensor histidine kinase UhpB